MSALWNIDSALDKLRRWKQHRDTDIQEDRKIQSSDLGGAAYMKIRVKFSIPRPTSLSQA